MRERAGWRERQRWKDRAPCVARELSGKLFLAEAPGREGAVIKRSCPACQTSICSSRKGLFTQFQIWTGPAQAAREAQNRASPRTSHGKWAMGSGSFGKSSS